MSTKTWISPANSFLGLPEYQDGFNHVVALCQDNAMDGFVVDDNTSVGLLTERDLLPTESFDVEIDFSGEVGEPLIGEGRDRTTFYLKGAEVKSSLSMPLLGSSFGIVDYTFIRLWELCRNAAWGSGYSVSGLTQSDLSTGDTIIQISNIEEFASLGLPFVANLGTEVVNIIAFDPINSLLLLENPLTASKSSGTLLAVKTRFAKGPRNNPSITLLSTQEGKLLSALVDKISIDVSPSKPLSAKIDFQHLGLSRSTQIPLKSATQNLTLLQSRRSPVFRIEGQSVTISLLSGDGLLYGLSDVSGDPLLSGFQGIGLSPFTITGINLSIDNHLKVVHTAKSLSHDSKKRTLSNRFGLALTSEGRTITGQISYKSPIQPRKVLEKLAGASGMQGGGIKINYGGAFCLHLNDVAWSLSKGNSSANDTEDRTINFSLISKNRDAFPELLWESLS